MNGKAGAPGSEMPRGLLLPAIMLAAHFADFDTAVPFVDRSEGGSGFDGLELLRISNQDNFCAGIVSMGQHALHLARADHASLVDHQHVARSKLLAALSPLMFKARDGARGDARPMLQTFGSDARQCRPTNIVTSTFPRLARNP